MNLADLVRRMDNSNEDDESAPMPPAVMADDMLTKAALATCKYAVWRGERQWIVGITVTGITETEFGQIVDARAHCDLLNLRAVLEAMRDPSDRMVRAGLARELDLDDSSQVFGIWRGMVDAVIAETDEELRK